MLLNQTSQFRQLRHFNASKQSVVIVFEFLLPAHDELWIGIAEHFLGWEVRQLAFGEVQLAGCVNVQQLAKPTHNLPTLLSLLFIDLNSVPDRLSIDFAIDELQYELRLHN